AGCTLTTRSSSLMYSVMFTPPTAGDFTSRSATSVAAAPDLPEQRQFQLPTATSVRVLCAANSLPLARSERGEHCDRGVAGVASREHCSCLGPPFHDGYGRHAIASVTRR